jgi:hypothetical protein
LASSQRTATRREPASTTAFGRREAKKLGFRARASRPNKYSSKVQQCPRRSARSNEVRTHSARFNNTKRGQCHDFASKGLGVRVPLAPLLVGMHLPLLSCCTSRAGTAVSTAIGPPASFLIGVSDGSCLPQRISAATSPDY